MQGWRERYEDYCAACERDLYRVYAGAQADSRLLEIDAEYGDLTSGDALEGLVKERDEASGAELRERLQRRIGLTQDAVIESRSRPLRLELREAVLRRAAAERVSELRERLLAEAGQARAKLGFGSGLARVRARRPGVDLEGWRIGAQRLLAATQGAFDEARGAALAAVQRSRTDESRAARRDALGLLRFAELFPAERLLGCLSFTCEGLSVRRDCWSSSAAAHGGTRVWPIRVPAEIALTIAPFGGSPACAELFSAAGQALAFGHTSSDLEVERRRPWDRALRVAWALLLRQRLADWFWLEDFPAGRHAEDLARGLRFAAFYELRACAGRLDFEWALAELEPERDVRRWSSLYAERMREATGFEHPAEHYLAGADAELPALDELRGHCLAQQLVGVLRQRFGRKFWRVARAGALLKEIWDTGSSYTAEQLAEQLDLGALDLEALAEAWGPSRLGGS